MRAILLSAGQGRRLLPLTARDPKCLLRVGGRPILEMQLRTLASCGVRRATVLVGFGAERVERFLERTAVPGIEVSAVYNPFYYSCDNLVTCWVARSEMSADFLLLNGDTLFEPDVLARTLAAPDAPVVVTVDRKDRYDDDDMKVTLDGRRLIAVGKKIPGEAVDAECIGLMRCAGSGAAALRDALERSVRSPDALRAWYLAAVHELAQRMPIQTVSIEGLWWREVDSHRDLAAVRARYGEGGA